MLRIYSSFHKSLSVELSMSMRNAIAVSLHTRTQAPPRTHAQISHFIMHVCTDPRETPSGVRIFFQMSLFGVCLFVTTNVTFKSVLLVQRQCTNFVSGIIYIELNEFQNDDSITYPDRCCCKEITMRMVDGIIFLLSKWRKNNRKTSPFHIHTRTNDKFMREMHVVS